jgi:hypothetical protein
MKRANFTGRTEVRRAEAVQRAEDRATRTPQEQLRILDRRLGAGVGAQKERLKLNKLIEAGK